VADVHADCPLQRLYAIVIKNIIIIIIIIIINRRHDSRAADTRQCAWGMFINTRTAAGWLVVRF